MKTLLKLFLALIIICIISVVAVAAAVLFMNVAVQNGGDIITVLKTEDQTISAEETAEIKEIDPECAIVLGAGITDSETPSPMLKDRLDAGVLLYKQGLVPRLLLTGDNGQDSHNEIHVMLKYCKEQGVPGRDIFCDHAGFSTYDSMYRAVSIFEVKRAIIVTQKYHIYRALYLANKMGIKCAGVASDQRPHAGQDARDVREVLARVKDYLKAIRHPESQYTGGKIPITSENGVKSHGE